MLKEHVVFARVLTGVFMIDPSVIIDLVFGGFSAHGKLGGSSGQVKRRRIGDSVSCQASTCAWLLAFLATANSAFAQQPPSFPPADKDPFVGTWKANGNLSRPKLGKREASYTRTLTRQGDELAFPSKMENFKASEHDFRIRCDGLTYHVPKPDQSMTCQYMATQYCGR